MKYENSFATICHGVDLDLSQAWEMARIECNMGISTTYFFLVSSNAYNIFSKDSRDILNKIVLLGHDIGLHYNPLAYDEYGESENISKEVTLLESILNSKVKTISWHRLGSLSIVNDVGSDYFHTCKPPFFNTQMKYFADSYGKWRYGHPLESDEFKIGYPLHICFHPVWWGFTNRSPSERLNLTMNRHDENFKCLITEEILPDFGKDK